MGRYTSIALVEAELEEIEFTADTKVTADNVTEFIDQEEAVVDAGIAAKYITPVPASKVISIALLRQIATFLVGYRVLKIIKPQEADGFVIDQKVEMLLSSDTPVGVTKSMGLAMLGFADAFAVLQPDLVVVLGDRYEIFAAASAAMIARIPIAHLHGGETTEVSGAPPGAQVVHGGGRGPVHRLSGVCGGV